jgi:hypothetical protein
MKVFLSLLRTGKQSVTNHSDFFSYWNGRIGPRHVRHSPGKGKKGVMDVKARFAGCREEGKCAGCNPKQMEEHVEKRERMPVVRL